MITKRIIPCLDVRNGRVVKGTNFESIKDVADPVEMARMYNAAGADELVFYDITASAEGRALFTDILTRVASEVFIPLTVGGGINTLEDFDRVLCSGCGRRHFWGWRWHIRRFIWEFCMGADLMSIWKMGLEAVSLENAMPCFACWRRLEWDVWYRRGLWRIVCAMQRPCRRLEPVSYWQF